MAGPIIEKLKDVVGEDSVAEEVIEDSPLFDDSDERFVEQYADELGRRVPQGGGCCSAAEVAQTIRDQQKYD
jgi:hypothetical protein